MAVVYSMNLSVKANNTNTNQLLERCKQQDHQAQMELYKQYYKAMYTSAYRILGDAYEAEDVMQEAFLTAFKKINSYRGEVAFGAWLKKIVINKSLTQLKRNKRYQEVKLEVVPTMEEEDEAIDFSQIKASEALEALQGLKENYKTILTLYLIEGYDYEEIGEILNYSQENVRTTISRAKQKLKTVLLSHTY